VLAAAGAQGAATCRLETSYRCPAPVARLAQDILGPLAPPEPPRAGREGVPVGRFDFPTDAHAHLFLAGAARDLVERERDAVRALAVELLDVGRGAPRPPRGRPARSVMPCAVAATRELHGLTSRAPEFVLAALVAHVLAQLGDLAVDDAHDVRVGERLRSPVALRVHAREDDDAFAVGDDLVGRQRQVPCESSPAVAKNSRTRSRPAHSPESGLLPGM
jgi:hypothetical protein